MAWKPWYKSDLEPPGVRRPATNADFLDALADSTRELAIYSGILAIVLLRVYWSGAGIPVAAAIGLLVTIAGWLIGGAIKRRSDRSR